MGRCSHGGLLFRSDKRQQPLKVRRSYIRRTCERGTRLHLEQQLHHPFAQMGCQCCKMLKSYIYDTTGPVDVPGRKVDPAESSLYQLHSPLGDGVDPLSAKHKQGFHNLGFSNNKHDPKLEVDNNRINRLHGAPANPERERGRGQEATLRAGEDGGVGRGLYILHPEGQAPRRASIQVPNSIPVYPSTPSLDLHLTQSGGTDSHPEKRAVQTDSAQVGCDTLSADDLDEGVGGTPEYPCDTGDEESVLSADIQTSTTSLSSVETNYDQKAPNATPAESRIGSWVTKSEDEGHGAGEGDSHSVTDSMVAEALAALEAATAGEDCEE
ncbi:hypothetical protein UPYG_G00242610 [Umbra pygmaea]|uniref:Uncharacterized protein n=1 Tax=Umbra pygmaea TaxID=75934 RepID=A0ABD0X3G6_UMBPY